MTGYLPSVCGLGCFTDAKISVRISCADSLYILPRDVASVFINVARHRIVLSAQGRM